jgi:hypothetical protein
MQTLQIAQLSNMRLEPFLVLLLEVEDRLDGGGALLEIGLMTLPDQKRARVNFHACPP